MKKVVSVILIISIAVLLVFSLCGCLSAEEKELLGTWEHPTEGYIDDPFYTSITFNSDHTFSILDKTGNTINNLKWEYEKDKNRFLLYGINGEGDYASNTSLYARIASNKLNLYISSGSITVFVKR